MDPKALTDFWPTLGESAGWVWQLLAVFLLSAIAVAALKTREIITVSPGVWRITPDEAGFRLLILAGIILLRSPTWMMGQTNVDEAQWLAGAITLGHDYAFWGTVDGTTSGPLVIHALYWWNSAFGAMSFESAKVFSSVIWALVVLATYLGFTHIMDRRTARIMICPLVGVAALMHSPEYVGYNGEQLPILLLAFCFALLCRLFVSARPSHWDALFLGLALGLLPYTKLQAVPMGLLFGGYGLLLLLRRPLLITLVGAALLPNIIILVYLFANGWLTDFWTSYVMENIEYSHSMSSVPFIKRPYGFLRIWFSIEEARSFVILSLAATVAAALPWVTRVHALRSREGGLLCGALCYLAVAALCVALPGTFFGHYYLFMLHPLAVCLAVSVSVSRGILSSKLRAATDFAVIFLLYFALAAPGVVRYPAFMDQAIRTAGTGISPVSARLLELAGENTQLGIWGWAPHLYVQTLLPQASEEAHTFRQINPGKYQQHFLQRLLEQWANSPNLLLVDAVNSGESKYFRDEALRLTHYPEMARFVAERMVYIDEINGARLYKSKSADSMSDNGTPVR